MEIKSLAVLGSYVLVFLAGDVAAVVCWGRLIEALVSSEGVVAVGGSTLLQGFVVALLLLVTAIDWLTLFITLAPISQLLVERCCVLLLLLVGCSKTLVSSVLDKVTAHLISAAWHGRPCIPRTEHI